MLLSAAPIYPDRIDQVSRILTVFVLLVFVFVLTGLVTRWIASFEKGRMKGSNIQLLEAQALAGGKYIQIVRVGGKLLALAVCKDSVTMLCELEEKDLQVKPVGEERSFSDWLVKALKKGSPAREGKDASP